MASALNTVFFFVLAQSQPRSKYFVPLVHTCVIMETVQVEKADSEKCLAVSNCQRPS